MTYIDQNKLTELDKLTDFKIDASKLTSISKDRYVFSCEEDKNASNSSRNEL